MIRNNQGFVLKNVLILIMGLTSILFSSTYYYVSSLKIAKQSLLLEKQKAVELIVYSYFLDNLKRNETIKVDTSSVQIEYTITCDDKTSTLDSRICFESCYQWNVVYDLKNKNVVKQAYSSI